MRKIAKYAIWTGVGLIMSLILSVFYYLVFSTLFSTDTEKKLLRQNRLLREEIPYVERSLSMLEDELEYLKSRDAYIYKSLFDADAPSLADMADVISFGGDVDADRIEQDWQAIYRAVERKDFVAPPLLLPVEGVSSRFVAASTGDKINPFYKTKMYHDGVDIVAPAGALVRSTAPGHVSEIRKSSGGKGNVVEITHFNGYQTRYSHLDEIRVSVGSNVRTGTVIGTVGDSGRSFTTHLHYQLIYCGKILDPILYFCGGTSPAEYVKMISMGQASGQSLD